MPCWQQGWVPQREQKDTLLLLDVPSTPEPRLAELLQLCEAGARQSWVCLLCQLER